MAPAHMRVRNVVEETGHAGGEQRELERVEQERDAAGHRADESLRRRDRIRGDAQAQAEQQRPEGDRGPVDEHALRDRPRRANAPDRIERAVDGEHQRERSEDEEDEARLVNSGGIGSVQEGERGRRILHGCSPKPSLGPRV